MTEKIIGIDLGTTFSSASFYDHHTDQVKVVKTRDQTYLIPSVVRFDNGKTVVGWRALRAWALHTENTFGRVKPQFDDPDFTLNGHSPLDFNKALLTYLAEELNQNIEGFNGKVVITVPAYTGPHYNELINEAAHQVGLEVAQLLSEPVSAGMAYYFQNPDVGGILIVPDIGGGTTDISVIELKPDAIGEAGGEVLANFGNLNLGGRDIDDLILKWFCELWQDEHGGNPLNNPRVKADWTEKAEEIKIAFSTDDVVERQLNADGNYIDFNATRQEFEQRIEPLVNQVMDCVDEALDRANKAPGDIDVVTPVGGTSVIPLIRQRMEEKFNRDISYEVDPQYAVAFGAAYLGADLAGHKIRDKRNRIVLGKPIKDKSSIGIGVKAICLESGEPYMHILIPRNQSLPAEGWGNFMPLEDDQEQVQFDIYVGDSEKLEECQQLVEGYLLGIKYPRKRENVHINAGLKVDKSGVIWLIAEGPDGEKLEEKFRHPKIVEPK